MSRLRIIAAAALLASATPALAEDYRLTPEQQQTAKAADRWEMAYIALAAIDTVQTISCIERDRCEETNPIMGKNPKAWKLIAVKVAGVGLQYVLFNEVRKRDPKMALRVAQISVAAQGAVVALNMRFVF